MENNVIIIGCVSPGKTEYLQKAIELSSDKHLTVVVCDTQNFSEIVSKAKQIEFPIVPRFETTEVYITELKKTRKEKKQQYNNNYRKNWRKTK